MRVLVVGPGGFIGRALVAGLRSRRGHINLYTLDSPEDPSRFKAALNGVHTAWYLIHRFGDPEALVRDPGHAAVFAEHAARARVKRIVFVGALGDPAVSMRVASRRAVAQALAQTGVPVTEVRTSLVVGHGGAAIKVLRAMMEHLPVPVVPRRSLGRVQPVALADLVEVLIRCGPPRFRHRSDPHWQGLLEVGGPDVVTWRDLLALTGEALGRPRRLVEVPWDTPRLMGLFLSIFAPFGPVACASFVREMACDAVVGEGPTTRVQPTSLLDALATALERR